MKPIRHLLVLLILITACTPRTPQAQPVTTTSTTEASPTLVSTSTPVADASPTPSPDVEATLALTPVAQITPDPSVTARHLRIFEQLWNTVNTQYVYPDFNGLDWDALYDEYSTHIADGLDDEGFWTAMTTLVTALQDDHSNFLSPAETQRQDNLLEGDFDYVGIGIYVTVQDEKKQAVILHVFPDSPAAQADLNAHDVILGIEGQPIINSDDLDNLDLLRGASGTDVAMIVRSPGGAPREVIVTRRHINGSLRASGRVLSEASDRRIAYLMIPTLWDVTIESSTEQVLRELMVEGDLDGLVVDMRINSGGLSSSLIALLGHFTSGQHGEFVSRDEVRPLTIFADPIGNSQEVPLIILVSAATESYGEVFSGVLREANRALLVGNTTAGNIETIYGYDFEDGSRAWIARETFVPVSGDNWEQLGIVPDLSLDLSWDEFTDEDDPHIAAALDLLLQKAGVAP